MVHIQLQLVVAQTVFSVRAEYSTLVLVLILSIGIGIIIAASLLETLLTLTVFDFCSWAPTLGIQLQPGKTFQRKSGLLVSVPRCFGVKWQSNKMTKKNNKNKTKGHFSPSPKSTENSRFISLAWWRPLSVVYLIWSKSLWINCQTFGEKNDSLFFFSVSVRCFARSDASRGKNEQRALTEEAAERTGRARKRMRQVQHLWNVTRGRLGDFFFLLILCT